MRSGIRNCARTKEPRCRTAQHAGSMAHSMMPACGAHLLLARGLRIGVLVPWLLEPWAAVGRVLAVALVALFGLATCLAARCGLRRGRGGPTVDRAGECGLLSSATAAAAAAARAGWRDAGCRPSAQAIRRRQRAPSCACAGATSAAAQGATAAAARRPSIACGPGAHAVDGGKASHGGGRIACPPPQKGSIGWRRPPHEGRRRALGTAA